MKALLNKLSALLLFSVFLVACGGMPVPSDYTSDSSPAVTQAAVAESPSAATVAPAAETTSSWTPEQKCEWLRANFPQTTEGIQALGVQLTGVVPERVRTHVYRCTPETTVFDGLIIVGPNEGYSGTFTIAVPAGGAVDSYAEATYSGTHELLGSATDTVRAFDGTVTAVTATYWPWLDEAPPVSGGTSASQPIASGTCMDPTALAAQHNWTYTGTPDQYGGLVVTLSNVDTLPADWEAVTQGHSIKEFDVNREMSAGTHTIYPPYSCRAALGYSQ